MAETQRKRGRPKGSLNKATADIKALAQVHTPRALQVLANIMEKSESDPARVAAAKEMLDRGHGKSTQPISGGDEGGLLVRIIQVAE